MKMHPGVWCPRAELVGPPDASGCARALRGRFLIKNLCVDIRLGFRIRIFVRFGCQPVLAVMVIKLPSYVSSTLKIHFAALCW